MTREEVALQVFLKKMPTTPLTDESRMGFNSTLEQSFEIADLFLKRAQEKDPPEEKR